MRMRTKNELVIGCNFRFESGFSRLLTIPDNPDKISPV